MSKTFSIRMDLTGLRENMKNIVKSSQEVVRPSAQAGAQVIYDQARSNVAALGRKTGNLHNSIYQKYSTDNSTKRKSVYHVSWNINKAPHGRLIEWGFIQRYEVWYSKKYGKFYIPRRADSIGKDKPKRQKRPPYSHKPAYGRFFRLRAVPLQIPAHPFMRNAIATKSAEARKAMTDRFMQELRTRGFFKQR